MHALLQLYMFFTVTVVTSFLQSRRFEHWGINNYKTDMIIRTLTSITEIQKRNCNSNGLYLCVVFAFFCRLFIGSFHCLSHFSLWWITIASAGHALAAGFNVMQLATCTSIVSQRPRSSADVLPPAEYVCKQLRELGLRAQCRFFCSRRAGLRFVTVVMSSKNGFVYNRCLLLNVYIRQCPLLCLSAFVLPGRPQF